MRLPAVATIRRQTKRTRTNMAQFEEELLSGAQLIYTRSEKQIFFYMLTNEEQSVKIKKFEPACDQSDWLFA